MAKIKKSTIKIIAATSMCIFSLASVFSATIAWFTMVQNTATDSSDMPVKNLEDSVRSITFHNFVSEVTVDEETYYTFSTTPTSTVTISDGVASQVGKLEMGLYALDDPHHPVLMLLELNPGTFNITFNITDENTYYIADGGEGHTVSNESNPLSSVVEFYSFTYSKTASDATSLASRTISVESANYYSLKTSEFVRSGTGANQSSFVQLDNTGDYDDFVTEASLFSGNANDYAYLGVVIDYYSESLQYIYSYFMGDQVLNEDLMFSCDWEMRI